MRQTVEPLGGRVLFGIGAVDAIHIGGLQDRLRADFGGPQHSRGIGGEERVAGSAAQQHDPAFGEIFVRRTAGEQFADLRHDER